MSWWLDGQNPCYCNLGLFLSFCRFSGSLTKSPLLYPVVIYPSLKLHSAQKGLGGVLRDCQVACIFLHYITTGSKNILERHWKTVRFMLLFVSNIHIFCGFFTSWLIFIILSNFSFYVTLTKKAFLTIFFPKIINLRNFCVS